MYYILDTTRSSQIILPMQNLERTCKVDKEFEVVLLSSQTESRTSEGSNIKKMLTEISGPKTQIF